MMCNAKAELLALIFLAGVPTALCQVTLDRIAARAGIIGDPWRVNMDAGRWRFIPEGEMGGLLFLPCLSWCTSWGYWTQAMGSHFPIALVLLAGIAEHFSLDHSPRMTGYSKVGGNSPWEYRHTFNPESIE